MIYTYKSYIDDAICFIFNVNKQNQDLELLGHFKSLVKVGTLFGGGRGGGSRDSRVFLSLFLDGHGLVYEGLQLLVVGGLATSRGGRSRLTSDILQKPKKSFGFKLHACIDTLDTFRVGDPLYLIISVCHYVYLSFLLITSTIK